MLPPILAVDIGNNRIKLGRFDDAPAVGLPEPTSTLAATGDASQWDGIGAWLAEAAGPVSWWIGSVNRPTAGRLIDWLRERRPADEITLLACGDLPLAVRLARPDMVGVDRLLDAVAANRLRALDRPAVVVDIGTAITVDLVSADGAFCGGAIAPGIGMSARALHSFTDLLPLLDAADFTAPPPPLGVSTVDALQSGLFWGAVGLIRELVRQLGAQSAARPQVFVTGGAAPAVAGQLGPDALHVPHLTLAGIAITASGKCR